MAEGGGVLPVADDADDMAAIGHLDRWRRSPADGCGIPRRSFAADEGHGAVRRQPGADGVHRAIGQHVDGAMTVQVDDETAGAMAWAHGPGVGSDAWAVRKRRPERFLP